MAAAEKGKGSVFFKTNYVTFLLGTSIFFFFSFSCWSLQCIPCLLVTEKYTCSRSLLHSEMSRCCNAIIQFPKEKKCY